MPTYTVEMFVAICGRLCTGGMDGWMYFMDARGEIGYSIYKPSMYQCPTVGALELKVDTTELGIQLQEVGLGVPTEFCMGGLEKNWI